MTACPACERAAAGGQGHSAAELAAYHSGAELSARRTAAAAVADDFDREANAYIASTGECPEWSAWAWRLRTELRLVLDRLDAEQSGPLEQLGVEAVLRQHAAIRAVFDVFDWETDDRQYALEQIEDILRGQS